MTWNPNDDQIEELIDSNIVSSPPAPARSNTASSVRLLFKMFWTVIRGNINNALEIAESNSTDIGNEALAHVIAVKTAAESLLATASAIVNSGATPKGGWNAATNTPTLSTTPSAAGDIYDVTVAGTQSITGASTSFGVGDRIKSDGTSWYRIPFGIGDGTITPAKFNTFLNELFQQMPDDSDYFYALQDAQRRIGLGIRRDGFIEGKFIVQAISMMANAVHTASIQAGAVSLPKLAQEVKDAFPAPFDATDSDYLFLLLDAMNRIGLGLKKDGTIVGKIGLANASVTEAMLATGVIAKFPNAAYNRLNTANRYDVDVEDDGLWRGVEIEIPTKTEAIGYGFAHFPNAKTRLLKGVNDTGTTLLFKRSGNLPLRGRRYRGTFNPTSSGNIGSNLIGKYGNSYTNTYPAFPAGNTGDCWLIDCGNTTATKTANSLTFKNGDLLVKTAGGHIIQPGPGDGTFQEGDFWNITAGGTFGGISLLNTGRLLMPGFESISGPKYVTYLSSKPGECFLMGECDPSTFVSSSPRNGDVYIFSAAGTTQGITGVIGDSLVYDGGWGLVTGEAVTVANGNSFLLTCQNAADWSVRRVDKSTTSVNIKGKGLRTTSRRRNSDELLLISDSMFGSVGPKILTQTGRTGNVHSYGGGSSNDVLNMLRYLLRTNDTYAGRVHVFWHGQNNQTDTVQTKNAAYQMASLVGSIEKRFVFWSILGQRSATFNGTRIVCSLQEDAFAGTNHIAEIERFYEAAFPQQSFIVRKKMLETAVGRNIPDPQFPGMTEEQVASTYGIIPFSYFFDYNGKPFTAANLTFSGYHSAAGLPTGGSDKNYYIRTANGTIGQLIVNVAGTWIEYDHDVTHLYNYGGDVVAAKFKDFLTTINI